MNWFVHALNLAQLEVSSIWPWFCVIACLRTKAFKTSKTQLKPNIMELSTSIKQLVLTAMKALDGLLSFRPSLRVVAMLARRTTGGQILQWNVRKI